jgi:phosphonate transport system permease protein
MAGTLAIAFRSVGFTGKLLAEALEEANAGSIEALVAVGAPHPSIITKGHWPQVKPAFWSISLCRWDINIRESAVLGRSALAASASRSIPLSISSTGIRSLSFC